MRRISVEGSEDKLKKSVALLLIRRQVAEWVIPGVQIRRAISATPTDIRLERKSSPRLPDWLRNSPLPPAEVGGCRFVAPKVERNQEIIALQRIPYSERMEALQG